MTLGCQESVPRWNGNYGCLPSTYPTRSHCVAGINMFTWDQSHSHWESVQSRQPWNQDWFKDVHLNRSQSELDSTTAIVSGVCKWPGLFQLSEAQDSEEWKGKEKLFISVVEHGNSSRQPSFRHEKTGCRIKSTPRVAEWCNGVCVCGGGGAGGLFSILLSHYTNYI